jgi:hypothetical protein
MKHSPVQPDTKLKLNGVSYELLFDFEAIATAEDLTDRPLLTGLRSRDYQSPTISLVRIMLFACLQAKHPEVTLDIAKAFVTQKNFRDVWTAVLTTWAAALAEPDPDEAESADPISDQS